MSTKTSIKRIALVAAAALALGGFSAVSARAADNTYIGGSLGDGVSSFALANTTLSGIAGPANFVKVGVATGSTGILTISGGTFGVSDSTTLVVNSAGTQAVATAVTGTANVNVPTPTVGTITVNYYKQVSSGVYASTATESVVITVAAAGQSGVFSAANSTFYISSGETNTVPTADATVTKASTINVTSAAASVYVTLKDALKAAYYDTISATITSGPGTLAAVTDTATAVDSATVDGVDLKSSASSPLYSTSATTNATNRAAIFGIFANGQTGTTVVSFKNSAGTVLGTKSVTFTGTTPLRIEATVKKNALNSATYSNKVLSVKLFDAATGGNSIPSLSTPITGTVKTGSLIGRNIAGADCAWNTTDLVYYCKVSAAATPTTAGGTEVYTLSAGTGVTTTASVTFVTGVATSVTIVPSVTSADPGSKVTYTLTATGLPDGSYAPGTLVKTISSNNSLSVYPFANDETITITNGVATSYGYAPFAGTMSLSWTLAGTAAAAQTIVGVNDPITWYSAAGLDKTITASTVAADDVTVTGNTEATAAANAATDAANQAADAADNATQAAAEALAAVNTLATTVATLIDGIKSQIKALNTLILAIKKKIKA
jgi:hypothetical protein